MLLGGQKPLSGKVKRILEGISASRNTLAKVRPPRRPGDRPPGLALCPLAGAPPCPCFFLLLFRMMRFELWGVCPTRPPNRLGFVHALRDVEARNESGSSRLFIRRYLCPRVK